MTRPTKLLQQSGAVILWPSNDRSKFMRHIAIASLFLCGTLATNAQEKAAWGSLSGKVIDGKTKQPVANAIVCLKSLTDSFPIHAEDRVRKDLIIQIPAGRNFDFQMITYYPHYLDADKKKVSTGQKLIFVGDKLQGHALRIDALLWTANDESTADAFKKLIKLSDTRGGTQIAYVAPGDRATVELKFLAGHRVQSETYAELRMHLFAFNHPYFAITQKDGSFTIPRIPAGKDVIVWAWQEDARHLLTESGKKMTFKEGKNTLDIESK